MAFSGAVPKLWKDSIDAHRREVHDVVLDAAARLAAEVGVAAVTMSDIATRAGIGRATLYKYFHDVGAILVAWHGRQIRDHLEELVAIRDGEGDAVDRLARVLETYAFICHEHHSGELAAMLHRQEHVARAQQHLVDFLADLVAEAAGQGALRTDVASAELATFCVHALSAASALSSKAAVRRLVVLTMAALQSP